MKSILIILTLCLTIPVSASAVNIIDIQSQTLRQVEWLDRYGYNEKVVRKYMELCTVLKANYCIDGYNLCMSG